MARVAWIGLGVMGFPMAGNLAKSGGHDIVVYNRSQEKAHHWVKTYGTGHTAAKPSQAAADADFVFCCVGNDDDVRAVTTGSDGAFQTQKPGTVFIDHTTASAEVARDLHQAAADKGFSFIDAPVSGGQAGAENGALTIMCGGDEEAFAKARTVMDTYAKKTTLMGGPGAGQLTKMVNQICIAGLLQGLSEGLHFAQRAGLDIPTVMDTIGKGAAQSWQLDNRWETMISGRYDHGFAVDWMRKDLDICLQEARKNGSSLPVAALVDQFYNEVQKMGGGRWDTSSLLARLNNADA